MSQMVLPQSTPKSAPSDAASAPRPSKQGAETAHEKSFDEISRSEQRRLDDKASARADSADKTERQPADRVAGSGSEKQARPADDASEPSQGVVSEDNSHADSAHREALLLEIETTELMTAGEATDQLPVTFASLQTLASAGSGATNQGVPFLQGTVGSLNGINGGLAGKNGMMALQASGPKGSPTSLALTDAMLGGAGQDPVKLADNTILQNAIRFQGNLDTASQQASVTNAPKLAPEASVLRGYTTSIDVPVSHAEWGDKLAGKLTWLTAQNMSVAEIHLTPPDMGPMEVRVQVQQDQANITVHSANSAVRDQLELHSHRLRDMLSEQGISLEQFDVSDSSRDQSSDGEAGDGSGQQGGTVADADAEEASSQLQSLDLTWKGQVDLFA